MLMASSKPKLAMCMNALQGTSAQEIAKFSQVAELVHEEFGNEP